MNRIRIGIADDHDMVRQSFVRLLNEYEDIQVVFEARNGEELFNHLQTLKVDILLLDIKMPLFDAKKALIAIKQDFPKLKIIVVSAYSEEDMIVKYVNLGADSFLPKHSDLNALVTAIHSVQQDGFYFEDYILDLLNRKGSSPLGGIKKLTEREILVLSYFCENKSPAEIATLLGVKEITIAGYKHRLFQKTMAENIAGLYEYAVKHRYIRKDH